VTFISGSLTIKSKVSEIERLIEKTARILD